MLKSHLRLSFYRSDITSAWIIAWLINIQVVAEQTGIKVERSSLLNVQQSWTFNFVADLLPVQQSRLCWIQLCCQCATGFNHLWLCSVQKLSKSVNICKSCHKSLLPRFYGALYSWSGKGNDEIWKGSEGLGRRERKRGGVSFIRFRWLYPRGVEEPDYMEEI